MELIIYTNDHYEEEKALVDLVDKKVILKGDYYHDKISHQIEGYLKALRDYGIYGIETKRENIDSAHELYNELGFYNEEED